MIILDTNVVSELLRPKPARQVLGFLRGHGEALGITTITIHEISFGLERLPESGRKQGLAAAFLQFTESLMDSEILDLTEPAARRSGVLRAQRATAGRPISMADAHIAGIALETGHPLATRNTRDFQELGLRLIDPWQQ